MFRKIIRLTATLSAVVGSALIIITSFRSGANLYILTYFTMQSNLLVSGFLLSEVFNLFQSGAYLPESGRFHPAIHGALTLYILITCLVYNSLLAPFMEFTGIDALSMIITHTVTPLLFITDYLINRRRGFISWNHLKLWLIYPAAYLVESLTEGAITGQFRYPFLDFLNQPFISFIIQLGIVIAAFIAVGAMLILIDKRSAVFK